jgi:hypothetical protein
MKSFLPIILLTFPKVFFGQQPKLVLPIGHTGHVYYAEFSLDEKKIVGDRVQELTRGLQKPTSRNETIAVDWNLW